MPPRVRWARRFSLADYSILALQEAAPRREQGSCVMLLSHVHVGISNFDRAFKFYSGVMASLGFVLELSRPEKSWASWMEEGVPRPLFLIGHPFNGAAPNPGNGQMVAFLAPTRDVVDQCYAWATANGGIDEGGPGLRPHYHPYYYGAYFRDPDGNKICVCCHSPASNATS
jgi:catechol 2,3-dioxygenase-like lactoylglutathione lyase family enzyme